MRAASPVIVPVVAFCYRETVYESHHYVTIMFRLYHYKSFDLYRELVGVLFFRQRLVVTPSIPLLE